MTVSSYTSGDLFVLRIVKHHENNPDRKWANSYEFKALASGSEGELLDLGQALVDFEIAITRNFVVYDRLLISTWEADSVPYDPATFISSSLTAAGGVGSGATEPVALNVCQAVTRIASFGRFGHLFYRGVLLEGDVESPAGTSILTDRPGQQDALDAAIASSGLSDYIGSAPVNPLQLVMVNKDGTQVRPVTFLKVQGVTTLPMDHAWFNRTPPTP